MCWEKAPSADFASFDLPMSELGASCQHGHLKSRHLLLMAASCSLNCAYLAPTPSMYASLRA